MIHASESGAGREEADSTQSGAQLTLLGPLSEQGHGGSGQESGHLLVAGGQPPSAHTGSLGSSAHSVTCRQLSL